MARGAQRRTDLWLCEQSQRCVSWACRLPRGVAWGRAPPVVKFRKGEPLLDKVKKRDAHISRRRNSYDDQGQGPGPVVMDVWAFGLSNPGEQITLVSQRQGSALRAPVVSQMTSDTLVPSEDQREVYSTLR